MAFTTKQNFIDVWTELDAAYGALSAADTGAGTAELAVFGDYGDTTAYTTDSADFANTLFQFSDFVKTFGDVNTTLGEAALAVNLAFVELANAYVAWLDAGNPPILDIAKPRGASDPGQSFHDNILGNVTDSVIQGRFLDHTGLTVDVRGDAADDLTGDPRSTLLQEYGERPYFSGNAGAVDDLAQTIAWDIAYGFDLSDLDISRGGVDPLDGDIQLVTDTGVTEYGDIQAAIDAASAGDTIVLGPGTYTLSSRLDIDKGVSLVGSGEGQTTIETAATSWGVYVTADDVSITDLTVDASATTLFGVKVAPASSSDPANNIDNFLLENVTVSGSGSSEIDLNGVDNSALTNVTADGLDTGGVGIALSDSTFITLTDITTSGNNWGSIGLFSKGNFFEPGTNNITFAGSYTHGEDVGIYADEELGSVVEDIDLSAIYGDVYKVQNTAFRDGVDGRSDDFTFFFGTQSEAVTYATSLEDGSSNDVSGASSITLDSTTADVDAEAGTTFRVSPGMSIQAAVDAASSGDTIIVEAGVYREQVEIDGKDNITLVGEPGATIEMPDSPELINDTTGTNKDRAAVVSVEGSEGVTIRGFEIDGRGLAADVPSDGDTTDIHGIYLGNASGVIRDNTVVGVRDQLNADGSVSGNQRGNAIVVLNEDSAARTVNIRDNDVNDFQKNAITVNGDGLEAVIRSNTITGNGYIDRGNGMAQNGIQMSFGAGGVIDGNTISEIGRAGDQWASSYVLVYQAAAGVSVKDNDLNGVVEIGNTAGVFVIDTDDVGVFNNTFDDLLYGLTFSGNVDGAKKSGNTFANIGGPFNATAEGTESDPGDTIEGTTIGLYADGNDSAVGYFQGSAGDDALVGTSGDDALAGLGGDDYLEGGGGADDLYGGAGVDTASYEGSSSGVDVALWDLGAQSGGDASGDRLRDIENLTGSDHADNLEGDGAANRLSGGDGDDRLQGWGGDDTIEGDGGTDIAVLANGGGAAFNPADFDFSGLTVDGSGVVSGTVTGPDGTDTLSGIEILEVENTGSSTWVVLDGMSIQDAIDAASDGDTIYVMAGTYTEDLTISKGVEIIGANAGLAGDDAGRGSESVIDGLVTIDASSAVTIDGVQFLNDEPTGSRGQLNQLTLASAADHVITNSAFISAVEGGDTGGIHDVAIFTNVLGSGGFEITNNYFGGDGSFSDGDKYSTAAWGRGIWSNGGGAEVVITGNTFQNTRTGLNLENYDNAASFVSNNDFVDAGSGISVGVPTAGALTSIRNNTFQDVDTDFNLRNLSGDVSFNLGAFGNQALAGDSSFYSGGSGLDDPNGTLTYLSGNGADTVTGTSGNDVIIADHTSAADDVIAGRGGDDQLSGGGGNDTLFGDAGNDVLNGGAGDDELRGGDGDDTFNGGAGADDIIGGAGTDTVDYSDSSAGVNVRLWWKFAQAGGDATGDDLSSIENLTGSAFADNLQGTNDANVISGGDGADTLIGFGGDDTLTGGEGDDILRGGTGSDTFVFEPSTNGTGSDQIWDFADGVDQIDLSAYGLSGFGDLTVETVGSNIRISGFGDSDDEIFVSGSVTVDATDFIF